MKLTKNKWVNLVILKTIETASLCFVPFWIGELSAWLRELTSCPLFVEAQDRMIFTWIAGVGFIAFLVGGVVFIFFMAMGVHFFIRQNLEWAKKLSQGGQRK